MRLTTKRLAKLRSKIGRHGDGHGLYLQVLSPSNASWILRYQQNGRKRWMGLGPLHTIGLAEARERARKARQQLLDGIDPLDAKAEARAAAALAAAKTMTFEQAARQYFDAHEHSWRNAKHRAQFLSSLNAYVFPKIGKLPVATIDTGQVLRCIEPIWHAKTETANRVRGRIESVLDWAKVRDYRSGDNPARWKGHLAEVLPARERIARVEHLAALPFTEIAAFVTALGERDGMAARALEFLILTAARTGEVIGALGTKSICRRKSGPSRPGVSRAVASIGCRYRIVPSNCCKDCRTSETIRLSSSARAPAAAFQHGDGGGAQAHGSRRHHRPRFSFRLSRLGRRAHQLPQPCGRDGAGPRRRRQGRGRLPARRSVRQTRGADGGVVEVRRHGAGGLQCHRVRAAMTKRGWWDNPGNRVP